MSDGRTYDKYVDKGNIFIDIKYLMKGHDSMTIDEILHRDIEIGKYMDILSRAMNGNTPDNIFVYGQTGIGKSMVTKMVTSQLEVDAHKYNINVKTAYINCEAVHTNTGVIKRINSRMQAKSVLQKTMNSFDAHFLVFCDIINEFNGIPIIIFDEVDKLSNPDILNIFARIKENDFTDKNICIIGVTNDLKFVEKLDSRTRSVLSKSTIVFPPYTAIQLADILNQRAKLAFRNNCLSEAVIPLCSAFAAQEHGDARKALDLLRVSGEIAEREGMIVVEETHVRKAKEYLEIDEVKEVIRTLPLQTKLVLASCVYCTSKGASKVLTKDIYNTYKKFSYSTGFETLTQRRVTDLLSMLDMFGIIITEITHKGRYGRTKEISLNMPQDVTLAVLLDDSALTPLKDIALQKKQAGYSLEAFSVI
jgi:cell division control protein 6